MTIKFYPELTMKLRTGKDFIFTIIPTIIVEYDSPDYWVYFNWLVFELKVSISKNYCSTCMYSDHDYEHCHNCYPDYNEANNYKKK